MWEGRKNLYLLNMKLILYVNEKNSNTQQQQFPRGACAICH